MSEVSLELLTDEGILDYTRPKGGEKDHVILNHYDINLQGSKITPVPGGLYDMNIFGSPFEDQCFCGKIRQVSSEPCPNCGSRVYSKEEGLRRFARIELPFYYLNDLRFDIFFDLFNDIFRNVKIKQEFFGDDLRRNGYAGKGAKKFGIKVFDSCQFSYSKAKNELTVSEFITDKTKCSYEGLMAIIEKYFPERLQEYKRLINRYYLVQPAMMRPYSVIVKNGSKKANSNKLTIWYSMIARLCCVTDIKANQMNYEEVTSQFKTDGEVVRYTALLRSLINAGKKQVTDLLNTSKKNEARNLYSVRVKNSSRAPIVPSVDIPVDSIGLPVSIAYEMCREGFIKYLVRELNFTEKEARQSTKRETDNPELMRRFKEYAESQAVIANRQPTLHEYSEYALKIKLVDQDAIAWNGRAFYKNCWNENFKSAANLK